MKLSSPNTYGTLLLTVTATVNIIGGKEAGLIIFITGLLIAVIYLALKVEALESELLQKKEELED